MNKPTIVKCCGREILDSRGNPTVEAAVFLSDGTSGVAAVPSGASTGIYEAHERRDNDVSRYNGKGVSGAVYEISGTVSKALSGLCACEQKEIDKTLLKLDGTKDKSKLGANTILSVSLACAKAAANWYGMPLYKYLGGVDSYRLPIPMMNILNGGAHAANNVEIQEFMIVPVGCKTFADALRAGSEIYYCLGKILKNSMYSTTVGDEGGYAPNLQSDEQAIELIITAIENAGYSTKDVMIALDAAASEWYGDDGSYTLSKRGKKHTAESLTDYFCSICQRYPIMSLEDPLDQRDFEGWSKLTSKLGDKIMIVGDDLFVTNSERLQKGIDMGSANSILIKPNQIGTLSETLDVIHKAKEAGYRFIISHRSGETEDTTIADIAVGLNAPFIKAGAPCRSERVAKYNRLLKIEDSLSLSSHYGFLNMPTAVPKIYNT